MNPTGRAEVDALLARRSCFERRRIFSYATILLFSFLLIIVLRIDASAASSVPIKCKSDEVRDHDKITIAGCLSGTNGFTFSTYSGTQYELIADPALVEKHGGWPPGNNVCIQGTVSADGSAINVISITDIPQRMARLSLSIGLSSRWRRQTNKEYGLSLALPETFSARPLIYSGAVDGRYEDQYIRSNFPVENGAIISEKFAIASGTFSISRDLPGCGLDSGFDGRLVLFVNPEIKNRAACDQFHTSDPKGSSSDTFHGIQYSESTEVSGGSGTWYSYYFYHTFQNGLCYEFTFSSVAHNLHADDDFCACTEPVLRGAQYDTLRQAILSQLSFSKPPAAPAVSGK
jgi:hypothetical protein